jgi:predicted ATPase/DNA-binding winged helix-turn-helix (wHTH) protein
MSQIGRFELNLEMRTLCCGTERVRLGSRAFDILALLTAARGRLVTKDELIRHVWPDTIVEENNLQVHLSALRKALGPDRDLIVTLAGRGYQLAGGPADTVQPGAAQADDARPAAQRVADDLPLHAGELFGREAAIQEIAALLQEARVTTLTGAGGIGKTSLATAVVRQIAHQFPDGVYFVELAARPDAAAVLTAVADACGQVFAGGAVTSARIAGALAGKHCLVVLDNAEHVIDVVAGLTEVLVRCESGLRVLTTSRESLRISAESVFRVPPLDVPSIDAQSQEVLTHSAVRLFLHRARAVQPRVADDAASVSLIGEICRRLDGIPLAIELAAARASTLGIDGLHRRLDDRLTVLTGGRRTVLPRHQTLRATFDWSYALLDPAARAVFRRLSQFVGTFSIEDACAVAADRGVTAMSITTSVGELAEKSLLELEFDGPLTRYRLPESTRAYAREKLQDEGQTQSVAARHARYLQQRFEQQWMSVAHAATGESLDGLRDELDDARGVLDWAFSPAGDDRLGVELTGALVEALLAWSLVEECYTRASRAMAALVRLPAGTVDAACELRLRAALASALPHRSEAARLWHDVLLLATDEHNDEFQARALWGLWNATLSGGQIHASFMYATLFQMLADERGIELQRILADQVIAVSLHSLGEHAEARVRLESVLSRLEAQRYSVSRPDGFRVDPLAVANGTLARIIWIQGDPQRAMTLIDDAVSSMRVDTPEPSLSHVLAAVAVPLALLSGDLPTATRYLDMLRAQASLHRFEIWHECCNCLGAHLDILNGQSAKGLQGLETALAALQARGFRRLLTPPLGVYAQVQAHAGRTAEARRILMETLAFCNENGEQMFSPEIWRVLGVVALLEAHSAAARGLSPIGYEADAQSSFLCAMQMAQQQGARMWELRAAIPLAQLWRTHGRNTEATDLLGPLCELFPNPSASSDVRTAHALMNEPARFNISTGEELYIAEYGDAFGYFKSTDQGKPVPTSLVSLSVSSSEQDFFYFNNFT